MSKIGIIGDIHLSSSEKYGKYSVDLGMNTRTRDKLSMLQKAHDYFVSECVEGVVFLGDIFETVTPSERLRSAFANNLSAYITHGIDVWIILGNHDTNLRSLHSLMTLQALRMPEVTIIDEVGFIDEETLLVAYGSEDKIMEYVNDSSYRVRYLLGHIPFKPYFNEGIDIRKVAPSLNVIINGHFHHPNEHHLGSMCIYRRDEIDEMHSIGILDTGTGKFIRHEMTDRKFVKMDMTVEDVEELLETGIEEQSKDYIISMKITDTPENLSRVSVRGIRGLFPNALKVVVEKEVSSDSKTVFSDKNQEFNDLDEDMKNYCVFKKRDDMLPKGKDIVSEIRENTDSKSVLV